MSATILNFPSPTDLLCGGLPLDAVVATDWDGDWGGDPQVEVVQFLAPRPETGDDTDVFVTVVVDPGRMLPFAALVTMERPDDVDLYRLLTRLGVPDEVWSCFGAEQDWPCAASPSTTLVCMKRLGMGCGCHTCLNTEASTFACEVAAAALAYVAMHGGPSAQVNRSLMTALTRWVAFFTQPLSA